MQVSTVAVIGMIMWALVGYSLSFTDGGAYNEFIGGFSRFFLLDNGTDLSDILSDLYRDHLTVRGPADSLDDVNRRYARVYQTTVFEEKFSASYKKEHRSQNLATQVLFERPDIQYAYAAAEREEYFKLEESRNYNTKLYYNMGSFERNMGLA